MRKNIPIPTLTAVELARFWKKVDKATPNGCLEWNGYRTDLGYGQVGVRYKVYLVHRLAWRIHTGSDPGPLQVCHTCDNPPCVKREHLFLGTQVDNMADMTAKGRADHTGNLRGQDVGTAKLIDAQVIEIWRLHLAEGLGERRLGARFGVTPANIHSILSGQTWKHLIPKNPKILVPIKHGRPRRMPIATI